MELLYEIPIYWLLFLTVVAFCAGYIDAVAGGGGMLNLPALLFAGIPPVSALAVSKMSAIAGTVLAVAKYTLSKNIHWKTVSIAAAPCLIAAYIGGQAALKLSPIFLAWAILLCIPVALVLVLNDSTKSESSQSASVSKTLCALTPIGFYDGILGPGTGTYMTITVRKFLNFELLKAAATIKPLNLLSNIGAAIAFIMAGKVIWSLAIPMIVASSVGGWLGSHSAIKGGDVFIRQFLITVLIFMLIANIIKLFIH